MTTRVYEALVIVKAAGTEQEVARTTTQLEEPIKKVGGSVDSAQNIGRRKLAFRISKQSEGYYVLLRFQAPTAQLGPLERLFHLNDSVVRFMILNADETTSLTSITARLPATASRRAGQASSSRGPAFQRR